MIDLRATMSIHEIVLPETTPETEWIQGRARQKVSPTYDHGALQGQLYMALWLWAEAGAHGRVASEWRFRVAPPGAVVRPLVPDAAYLSFAELPSDAARELVQVPLGAPTVAVEIRSPDDRRAYVEHKVATYLASGTSAVFIVDPHRETIEVHGRDGMRTVRGGESLTHPALPGFALDVAMLFARAKR